MRFYYPKRLVVSFFFAYSFSLPPCNTLVSRNFGHFCKEWGKNTVMKILLEFSWNFSVSLYWKRKKYNVPIPLSPYSDTSVYHLHTWIVLLNLTVYFKAIEANYSTQWNNQLIFWDFFLLVKEKCFAVGVSAFCGHDIFLIRVSAWIKNLSNFA